MANLQGDIKKLKRGELIGTLATCFCGIVLIYFIICFAVSSARDLHDLQLASLISAPIALLAGIAVAAYCNLKYGGAMDKVIRKYILDVCMENAALMHPERKSLSFYLTVKGQTVEMQVNNYPEKIIFDFSELGKLTLARRLAVLGEIKIRLCITFCKLYERGNEYTDVAFSDRTGRKAGKAVFIIKDSQPDVKAYKQYLKSVKKP